MTTIKSKQEELITIPRRWLKSLVKHSKKATKDIDDHFDELCPIVKPVSIDVLIGYLQSAELMLEEHKPNQKIV